MFEDQNGKSTVENLHVHDLFMFSIFDRSVRESAALLDEFFVHLNF